MAVKRISPDEARELIDTQGYAYLDVRSVPEFEAGHPTGAYNVPLMHMGPGGMSPNPDFLSVVQKAFPPDAKLVLGCKAGGRSLKAAEMLQSAGFTSIVDQRAGYEGNPAETGWRHRGLPTSDKATPGRAYDPAHEGVTTGARIVVAGGTGALGAALVELLVGQGDRIAVPFRSPGTFDRLRARVSADAAVWGARADISTISGARAFLDAAAAALEGIDGVAVISGAYAGTGLLGAAPEDEWPTMMQANLETAHCVCRAAIPHLAARGGSVVTVGSRLVETGGAGAAAYVVSKAAVAALTRVLALEYRGQIRFNCVAPGTIDTPDNRTARPSADRSSWTSPPSIARVIAFLLSPASSPVTGAYVPVDGRDHPLVG